MSVDLCADVGVANHCLCKLDGVIAAHFFCGGSSLASSNQAGSKSRGFAWTLTALDIVVIVVVIPLSLFTVNDVANNEVI